MHTGQPLANEAEELKCVCPRLEVEIYVYRVVCNSHCRRFTGIEFAVTHSEPPTFFIIQKRERLSPDEGRSRSISPSSKRILDASIYSSPYGCILHHEQSHLPISGLVHCAFEPFSKHFDDRSCFTRIQADLVDVAFVATNLTRYSENAQATFYASHWVRLANHGARGDWVCTGSTNRETQRPG